MKNRRKVTLFIFLTLLLVVSIPVIQALLFSSSSQGAILVDKSVQADYIKSKKRFSLLFFGYVGCRYVCTPDLHNIASMYESKEFASIKNDVEIFFVNLTPQVAQEQPDLFAKAFNKDFRGVYLSKKELMGIDRNFGVYFARGLDDKNELDHSDNLYLVENQDGKKILKQIYFMHPLNTKKVVSDIIINKAKEE